MPAMVENCRSIGDATEAAMVSGLAPGSCAVIWMVGKSTRGSAATAQQPVGENAEHDERRRDQRRQNRPADAELGKVHGQDPAGALAPRGATLDAVGQAELAVGDDGLAALQAAFQDGFVLLRRAPP